MKSKWPSGNRNRLRPGSQRTFVLFVFLGCFFQHIPSWWQQVVGLVTKVTRLATKKIHELLTQTSMEVRPLSQPIKWCEKRWNKKLNHTFQDKSEQNQQLVRRSCRFPLQNHSTTSQKIYNNNKSLTRRELEVVEQKTSRRLLSQQAWPRQPWFPVHGKIFFSGFKIVVLSDVFVVCHDSQFLDLVEIHENPRDFSHPRPTPRIWWKFFRAPRAPVFFLGGDGVNRRVELFSWLLMVWFKDLRYTVLFFSWSWGMFFYIYTYSTSLDTCELSLKLCAYTVINIYTHICSISYTPKKK